MVDARVPFVELMLGGSRVAADVVRVEVDDHDRLIDTATVLVDDPHRPYSDFTREELTLKVDLGWETEHAVIFEGIVTRVSSSTRGEGGRQVRLVANDLSYRMKTTSRQPKNHTGKLSSILKSIVAQPEYAGIAVGEIQIDPDPEFTTPPLRQHEESDWQFIQRLAERYRARAFVEYNEGSSRFYFVSLEKLLSTETVGTLHFCPGFSELIDFEFQRYAAGAEPLNSTTLQHPSTGELVTSPDPGPSPEESPSALDPMTVDRLNRLDPALGGRYQAAAAIAEGAPSAAAQRPRRRVSGVGSDAELARDLSRPDRTFALGLRGEGTAVGTVKMRAKGKVRILGVTSWAEGDWYLRNVKHVFARTSREPGHSTFVTRFVVTK